MTAENSVVGDFPCRQFWKFAPFRVDSRPNFLSEACQHPKDRAQRRFSLPFHPARVGKVCIRARTSAVPQDVGFYEKMFSIRFSYIDGDQRKICQAGSAQQRTEKHRALIGRRPERQSQPENS